MMLWLCLKGRQVRGSKFRRQYGVQMFVVDFYCPELRLAIEVDGLTHEDTWHQKKDENRQHLIESYGVHFLRFSDEEVLGDVEKVIKTIEAEIDRLRGNGLLPPPRFSGTRLVPALRRGRLSPLLKNEEGKLG